MSQCADAVKKRYTRIYDTRYDTGTYVTPTLQSRRAYSPVPTHYVSTMCHTDPALAGERVPQCKRT